jgi:hypothetical protein
MKAKAQWAEDHSFVWFSVELLKTARGSASGT